MKGTSSTFCCLSFAIILQSVAVDARADAFYQPASSPIESEWRSAGSLFLEGIGQIMTGLAGIEGKELANAQSEMAKASASLSKVSVLYSNLQSDIKEPRKVRLDKIPPQRMAFMKGLFSYYKTELPSDERQAAVIAGTEAVGLAKMLDSDKERFANYKLEDVQTLIRSVTRVLEIGTGTAELLKYGLEGG
jgi:hypothetical protein